MLIRVPWLPFRWEALALKWVIFYIRIDNRLLAHEMVHVQQQTEMGLCVYLWHYIWDKEFRYDVEFEAYRNGSGMTSTEADKMAKRYI